MSITTEDTFNTASGEALVKDGCCSQGNSPDYSMVWTSVPIFLPYRKLPIIDNKLYF